MIIRKHIINLIVNNPKNSELLNKLLRKTLKSKSPNFHCFYNDEKTKELGKLVIDYKNSNNQIERNIFLINPIKFDFDDRKSDLLDVFYNEIKKMSDKSVSEIPKTKTKNGNEILKKDNHLYKETKPNQESLLHSIIYYSMNYEKEDVFDLVTKIFIRTAQIHSLPNGNKRYAVLLANVILSFFNIYTFKSYKRFSEEYLYNWVEIVTIAVTRHRQKLIDDSFEGKIYQSIGQELPEKELYKLVKKFLIKISSFKIL